MIGFSTDQLRKLSRPLNRANINTRSLEGRELSYIEGWFAVSQANAIFGYANWDRKTVFLVREFEQVKSERVSCGYTARVRVKVKTGDGYVVREGTGFGSATAPTRADAYERAIKSAETDATKRALVTFGNQFGLCLYDRDQAGVTPPSANCLRLCGSDNSLFAERLSAEGFASGLRQLIEASKSARELDALRLNNMSSLNRLRALFPTLCNGRGEHFADLLLRLMDQMRRRLDAGAAGKPSEEPELLTVDPSIAHNGGAPANPDEAVSHNSPLNGAGTGGNHRSDRTTDCDLAHPAERADHSNVSGESCDLKVPRTATSAPPNSAGGLGPNGGATNGEAPPGLLMPTTLVPSPIASEQLQPSSASVNPRANCAINGHSPPTAITFSHRLVLSDIDCRAVTPPPSTSNASTNSDCASPPLRLCGRRSNSSDLPSDIMSNHSFPSNVIASQLSSISIRDDASTVNPDDGQEIVHYPRSLHDPVGAVISQKFLVPPGVRNPPIRSSGKNGIVPSRDGNAPLARSRIANGLRIDKSTLVHGELRRIRDTEHLKIVANLPCLICNRQPSHAHHLKFAQRRGLGQKVSDEFVVPLCAIHHHDLHRGSSEEAWWKAHAINPLPIAQKLWEKRRSDAR